MSDKKSASPTGEHIVEHDGKSYKFWLGHWEVASAETLLGTGLLNWPGGNIMFNLALGYVMLEGQHGIESRKDVASLFDAGPAELFDDAIAWALVDFFQQYPDLAKGMEVVLEALIAKVEMRRKAKLTKK